MLKIRSLLIIFLLVYTACSKTDNLPQASGFLKYNLTIENAKQGFDPLKHGFSCDSLNAKIIEKGGFTDKLYVFLGSQPVDTLNLHSISMNLNDEEIMIVDFNYDGFCDLIIPNISSASHGGMDYYYYLYDTGSLKYMENKSLPKFNGGVKLDIKNHRVKIYCPYQDCFAYYKYDEKGNFRLDQGKFEVNP